MSLINTTVLMSGADYFSNDQPINPYYADESVDINTAQQEHDLIRSSLEEAGVKVTKVTPPSTSQDGVYTANWALVNNGKAVLSSLPEVRKTEEATARQTLQDLGLEVIELPPGLRFSGQGDALPCGEYLFAGSVYRSDAAAQQFAADSLGLKLIQLETVPQLDAAGQPVTNLISGWPDSFYYDVDLALAIIAGPSGDSLGTIAYCPEAFTPTSQQVLASLDGFDKITISEAEAKEAFACNLVSTGQTVIMSAQAPLLKAELEQRGLTVITPQISELAKGGGYIRCTTLTLS